MTKRLLSPRFTAIAALCSLGTAAALAQQAPPPGFTRTLCLKVKASDAVAFERLVTDGMSKTGPVGLQKGLYASITFARALYPSGRDALCDYIVSWSYAGLPPEITPKTNEALFQEAGMGSYAAFITKLVAISEVVRADLWVARARAGTVQTGDYFRLNRMKIKPGQANVWRELETKMWRPVMEARVADGELRGWVSYDHVMPAGSEQPYDAATIDVFPSWDKMWNQKPLQGYVQKAHPGLPLDVFSEKTNAARDLALAELYQVVTTHRKQ